MASHLGVGTVWLHVSTGHDKQGKDKSTDRHMPMQKYFHHRVLVVIELQGIDCMTKQAEELPGNSTEGYNKQTHSDYAPRSSRAKSGARAVLGICIHI